MHKSNHGLMKNENAVATSAIIGLAVGALLVIFIAAQMLPPLAGGLATAQANGSVTTLGVGGFMPILAIVFIAAVILLAIRFIGAGGGR